MQPVINHWIVINETSIIKDGSPLLLFNVLPDATAESAYRALQCSYAKFFKMDLLCKWAWLGAEALLSGNEGIAYEGLDKTKIAVVITTSDGCIDVDKKYKATINEIASPALFVYTLPNIMLGEISIRQGFKGEQACLVNDPFDANELFFWVNDLLQSRNTDACLCGFVNATATNKEVVLFWVTKGGNGIPFTTDNINKIYNNA
ncbi:MAG: hypothetical protein JST82_08510 [Bacteroidetes bacterium]|nr:hypothetical protein [Bacteroidota bacterium]